MIVAFDTTDKTTRVSWLLANGTRGGEATAARKATEVLVPILSSLRETNPEPVTALGVVTGPGSFTGIRVGLATALGLKAVLDIPTLGFTKPELVAGWAGPGRHLLVLPSGRGQLICCPLEDGRCSEKPFVTNLADLPRTGSLVLLDEIANVEGSIFSRPLTELILDRLEAGVSEADHPLTPLYVRPPDARQGKTLIERLLEIS